MNTKNLFMKTLPFVWAKLILGLAFLLVCAVLGGICIGLGLLFGDSGAVIMFFIWCGAIGIIRFAMMHYFGYLIKAGHIAVIAEACMTGKVPSDQVEFGKTAVKERFATSNIYFAVDKLVSGAVKQIQRGIEKLGNALDFIPGMDAVSGLAQFFIGISLGYIDECCLGWTFCRKEDSAYKSAADGVVIYAQNWKPLLKAAALTMLKTLLLSVLAVIVIFVPTALIFRLFKWNLFIAFIVACFLTWVAKFAFMDSYIMVKMMTAYMKVAPTTVITFDLYGKLSKLSGSFKELINKGGRTAPDPAYAETPAVNMQNSAPAHVFCGQCGAKNSAASAFCESCGSKLR